MSENSKLTYKKYLKLVGLSTFSHVTNPLLRIVEFGLVGTCLDITCIAALGIGTTLMNTCDWMLSPFRGNVMEESAKAVQSKDERKQVEVLIQHLVCLLVIGLGLIALKEVICQWTAYLYKPELEVLQYTKTFFSISVLGFPFTLMNYMIMGWLMGRGKTYRTATLETVGNTANIILAIWFVRYEKIGIAGLALANLLTQMGLGLFSVFLLLKEWKMIRKHIAHIKVWNIKGICKQVSHHVDVIIRVASIVFVTNAVIITSSRFGTYILVTNVIIMQVKGIMAYFFEGVSTAIRQLVVSYKEEDQFELARVMHKMTLKTVMYICIGMVMFYALYGRNSLDYIISFNEIKRSILNYDGWLLIYPMVAGWGVSAYGVYSSICETKSLTNIYIVAVVIFVFTYMVAVPWLGNHGIWMAFTIYYLVRSIALLAYEGHLYGEELEMY